MAELFCYIALVENAPGKRVGIVKYQESGYYRTNLDETISTAQQVKEKVAWLNQRLEIPQDVADSLKAGSMFGWHVKAAQRAHQFALRSEA